MYVSILETKSRSDLNYMCYSNKYKLLSVYYDTMRLKSSKPYYHVTTEQTSRILTVHIKCVNVRFYEK